MNDRSMNKLPICAAGKAVVIVCNPLDGTLRVLADGTQVFTVLLGPQCVVEIAIPDGQEFERRVGVFNVEDGALRVKKDG